MSFNSKIIGAGVLFFLGQGLAMGQKTKSDSTKVTKIEDVVLTVAYGKQKKEAIVGAISSVDSKSTSVELALFQLLAILLLYLMEFLIMVTSTTSLKTK